MGASLIWLRLPFALESAIFTLLRYHWRPRTGLSSRPLLARASSPPLLRRFVIRRTRSESRHGGSVAQKGEPTWADRQSVKQARSARSVARQPAAIPPRAT